MAWSWGGITFPVNPDLEGGIKISPLVIGSAMRTSNGTLRTDTIAEKKRITLRFSNLTLIQLNGTDGFKDIYNRVGATPNTLVLEDNSRSWSVQASHNGFDELETTDGGASGRHYGCVITLDEV